MPSFADVMKKIGDLAGHIAEVAAAHPQETEALLQIAVSALAKSSTPEK